MTEKTYTLIDGTKFIFEYDHNRMGIITLECMDTLMSLLKATAEQTEPTSSKMEQVEDEPQTCSFSDCDNFKNPDYERCIECKRKQIK